MKRMYVLQKGLRFLGFACLAGAMLLAIPDGLQACGFCIGENGCPASPGTNYCGGALCNGCGDGSTCKCRTMANDPTKCGCTMT